MHPIPFVSIITINYNQAEVTNQLLESLQHITYLNFEVIIVDNHSKKDNVCKLNRNYPNCKIIQSHKNLGFAGGNNLGIRHSNGKYVLLLNNDTEVAPGFLEPMVGLLEQNQQIGAVSPKIKYFDNPTLIQYAGFTSMNPVTLRMKAIGHKQIDAPAYSKTTKTHFAHGCAMMVPLRVIERVGPMPEIYFLYYEEHDWSKQITNAGFDIYYCPQSVVYHKESVSVKKNSVLKDYYQNRNRILYMRRNHPLVYKLLAYTYLISISVPKHIIQYLLKRKFEYLKYYLHALKWNLNDKAQTNKVRLQNQL